MPTAASSEDHELAGRFLDARALCVDLASEHTSRIAGNEKRCTTQDRYKAIAKLFYCCRAERRSLFQQIMLNKAKEQFFKSRQEEAMVEQTLLALCRDPHCSLHRRRAARQELDELRKQWDELAEEQNGEVITLTVSTWHYPSKSQRFIARFQRDGGDKFFARLDSAIRRYLKARVEGAKWAISNPNTQLAVSVSLLQLLALEWLRDKDALWRFLEACFSRWEAVFAFNGIHYQNVLMHNICETKIALDENGNNVVDPNQKILPQIAVWMQNIGAIVESNQSAVDCLRQRSSRNIREAKAELNPNHVTDLGVTRP